MRWRRNRCACGMLAHPRYVLESDTCNHRCEQCKYYHYTRTHRLNWYIPTALWYIIFDYLGDDHTSVILVIIALHYLELIK